jgi:hypothetical protein
MRYEYEVESSAPQVMTPFLVFAIFGLVGAAALGLAVPKRGRRAAILALAFLSFSGVGFAIYFGWPDWVRNVLIVLVALLLLSDLVSRTASRAPNR